MNRNLTPSEIAEIKNELFPELAEITRKAEKANGYSVFAKGSEKHTAFNEGYIAAACEYAAEIKRLREELEASKPKICKCYGSDIPMTMIGGYIYCKNCGERK